MIDESLKNGVSSWKSVGPIESIMHLSSLSLPKGLLLIAFILLTACTDYVQKMDDDFDEWEQAQQQAELSSSSQVVKSSSSVKSSKSSSSVFLSGDSREKSSNSTEKKTSSSSNNKASSSSIKSSSSSAKITSSSSTKSSSSSVKPISSSSGQKLVSSSSIKSCSSSHDLSDFIGIVIEDDKGISSSSSVKSVSSSSSENSKTSSSGKASWAYLNPAISYEEMTDNRDGQVYKTVKIGDQTWMAENLNYEADNSFCYNDSAIYCAKYGRLYTWGTAMDSAGLWSIKGKGCGTNKTCNSSYPVRGICPTGWHLPSKDEWSSLFTAVGGFRTAGKTLKSTSIWNESFNGTNYYGFSALPAGRRFKNGSYIDEKSISEFRSSTEDGVLYSYCVRLTNYDDEASQSLDKATGISVRCIKD